tara:strand:- start:861 stop:1757 length:897 start_codon:yes stop_codon:yes gene_type:complete
MTLPASGTLSMSQIAAEFGGSTPHSLSEYYIGYEGIPASGTIAFSDLRGTTKFDVLPIRNTSGVNNFDTAGTGLRTDSTANMIFAMPMNSNFDQVAGDLSGTWSGTHVGNSSVDKFYGSCRLINTDGDGQAGIYHNNTEQSDFKIGSGLNRTFEGWFRWNDVSYEAPSSYRYNYAFSFYGYSGGDRGWEVILKNKAPTFISYPSGDEETAGVSLGDNTWHHIAVVFSGTNLKLFVDGTKEVDTTFTTPSWATSGSNETRFSIGSSYWDGNPEGGGSRTRVQDCRGYRTAKYSSSFVVP